MLKKKKKYTKDKSNKINLILLIAWLLYISKFKYGRIKNLKLSHNAIRKKNRAGGGGKRERVSLPLTKKPPFLQS